MPNFIMNIRRTSKPGQEGALIASAVETLNGADAPGNVSFDTSFPVMADPTVTSALLFDSLSDFEKIQDEVMNNPERAAQFASTNALSGKVTTTLYRIIDPVELGQDDQGGMPKYMSRTVLLAKRGEASNVLNVVREVRSNLPDRKPMINMAVLGNPDVVRIVAMYRSLEELEMGQARGRESGEYQTALGQLAGLTTMVRQTLARVVHSKQ
jgi:hypothetical protein|tara:strand:- start:3 stop:635 length:633 start_codon:yes stop_codon:yes gene_type:complete